jgi:hypothetical protein
MKAQKIKSAICSYLSQSTVERALVRNNLDDVASQLPETVIFGGMIREFGLGNARRFNSDIDLVSLATFDDINAAVSKYSPTANKFGGLRFFVGKQAFDIWALEDTWAFKEGLCTGEQLDDLLKTTFFDVDAAIFHLRTKQYSYSAGHVRGIKERELELNLESNPNPDGMISRAIKLCSESQLAVGLKLAKYLVGNKFYSPKGPTESAFLDSLKEHFDAPGKESFKFRPQHALI